MSDTIWTLIYAGPHGVDVSAYESRSSAVYGAMVLMLSRISRIKDSAQVARIINHIEAKEFEHALYVYMSEVRETFEIDAKPVTTLGTGAVSSALEFARTEIGKRSIGDA